MKNRALTDPPPVSSARVPNAKQPRWRAEKSTALAIRLQLAKNEHYRPNRGRSHHPFPGVRPEQFAVAIPGRDVGLGLHALSVCERRRYLGDDEALRRLRTPSDLHRMRGNVRGVLATAAPMFAVFLVARAIQAVGAGGIFPVAAAAIADRVPLERRGSALGLLSAVWGLAAVVTHFVSWRWIFAANAPLGSSLSFDRARTYRPPPRGRGVRSRLQASLYLHSDCWPPLSDKCHFRTHALQHQCVGTNRLCAAAKRLPM